MVNDRAGHARHEGPVLPSRDVNRTQLRASPPRPRAPLNDRTGHAKHEGPVLPSREVNRTQLRAGLQTTSPSSEARHDRATHAKHQDPALPQAPRGDDLGEREHVPDCARARPRALLLTNDKQEHPHPEKDRRIFSHNMKGVYGPCLVIGSRSLIVTG